MSKRDFLREVDVQFTRLFGELNPVLNPRTSLDTCQGHLGGAAYSYPIASVVFPCCFHAAEESTTWPTKHPTAMVK
jgi:hypothetical protein